MCRFFLFGFLLFSLLVREQRVLNRKLKACDDGEQLLELFRTAEECGWQSNFLTYLAAVERAAALDDIESAEQLVERMEERSLQRDTSVYNVLMRGYAARGDVRAVFGVHKRMQADSCVPDVDSYCAMLHVLARADQHDEALELIDEMRDAGLGAAVARATPWNAIIAGHAAHDRLESIKEIFAKMQRLGVEPDARSYTLRIRVNIRKRYFDRALALLKTMWDHDLRRPAILYHELLDAISSHPLEADPVVLTEVIKLAEREQAMSSEQQSK